MDSDPAKDALLKDVMADTAPPDFREGLLRLTLGAVARRNHVRRRNRAILSAACVLMVLALGVSLLHRHGSRASGSGNELVVHSRPVDAGMLVTTQPVPIQVVGTSSAVIALVRTQPDERTFEPIGDDQLFALLAGRPAALVHRGPAQAELVFVNATDWNGFLVQ